MNNNNNKLKDAAMPTTIVHTAVGVRRGTLCLVREKARENGGKG